MLALKVEGGAPAKEFGQNPNLRGCGETPESEKGEETDPPLELSERNAAPNTVIVGP